MAKQKYYVVWQGNNTGIFNSWAECQLQIKGYPGAVYKSFKTKEEADEAFYGESKDFIGQNKKTPKIVSEIHRKEIVWDSISVDAACSGNPGIMEYRGVDTKNGDLEFFRQGPFKYGTNNIGEFLALVHGLAYLQKTDQLLLPIYSDSRTAMSWVRNKKVKSNLKKAGQTKYLWELVNRGLVWLNKNTYKNEILKWKTEVWGEIPADFGRK